MGELYSWMDRIYVVNKGFKITFSFSPDHENVIDISPPDKWFQRGVFDGKLFKISHEQICIGRCHARAHRGAMGLQEVLTIEREIVHSKDHSDKNADSFSENRCLRTGVKKMSASFFAFLMWYVSV